ncbi:MAG: hypothetical protein OH318_01360 [Candidatus Parvarchaeota archaeon]|nr:hypothetical protein [Candidatus Rehaiarchaeum fermentans]
MKATNNTKNDIKNKKNSKNIVHKSSSIYSWTKRFVKVSFSILIAIGLLLIIAGIIIYFLHFKIYAFVLEGSVIPILLAIGYKLGEYKLNSLYGSVLVVGLSLLIFFLIIFRFAYANPILLLIIEIIPTITFILAIIYSFNLEFRLNEFLKGIISLALLIFIIFGVLFYYSSFNNPIKYVLAPLNPFTPQNLAFNSSSLSYVYPSYLVNIPVNNFINNTSLTNNNHLYLNLLFAPYSLEFNSLSFKLNSSSFPIPFSELFVVGKAISNETNKIFSTNPSNSTSKPLTNVQAYKYDNGLIINLNSTNEGEILNYYNISFSNLDNLTIYLENKSNNTLCFVVGINTGYKTFSSTFFEIVNSLRC